MQLGSIDAVFQAETLAAAGRSDEVLKIYQAVIKHDSTFKALLERPEQAIAKLSNR
ncbi:MAG: hypothetical protein HOA81_16840 [Opitutales bacterium]|jgi:hypothetical protein|nr:hypothetical protein [Opitutales bacterium]